MHMYMYMYTYTYTHTHTVYTSHCKSMFEVPGPEDHPDNTDMLILHSLHSWTAEGSIGREYFPGSVLGLSCFNVSIPILAAQNLRVRKQTFLFVKS